MITIIIRAKSVKIMRASKESTGRTRLHPTLAWFKELFNVIYADRKSLSQQLEKAQAEYPKLMLAYRLNSIYARFLEKSYMNLSRRRPIDKPVPDGDVERIITWPPEIEAKDIFQQLDEWSAAMVQLGAEVEAATRTEVRACPIIKQDYKAAADCVQKYFDNPPQTDEE